MKFLALLSVLAAASATPTTELPYLQLYRVASLLNPPFLQLKDGTPGQYEGFVVDLSEEFKKRLDRDYEIRLVPDQKYGYEDPQTHKWNGLIGYLLDGEADVAIADLTVNEARSKVIDFSDPIVNTGVGILYSSEENSIPFSNFEELVNSGIPFGVVKGGSTYQSIVSSSDAVFQKAASYLESHPDALVESNAVGYERAAAGHFAFLSEASTFPRVFKLYPQLRQFGDLILTRQYAIAIPKESQRLSRLNKIIKEVREDGTLDQIKTRWLIQEN